MAYLVLINTATIIRVDLILDLILDSVIRIKYQISYQINTIVTNTILLKRVL